MSVVYRYGKVGNCRSASECAYARCANRCAAPLAVVVHKFLTFKQTNAVDIQFDVVVRFDQSDANGAAVPQVVETHFVGQVVRGKCCVVEARRKLSRCFG